MAWAAIDPNNGMLAIGAAKAEHHLCQQIPGCNYSKTDSIWRVPLSWPAYVCLRTVWGSHPLTESAELTRWAASAWGDVQIAYGLRGSIDAPAGIRAELREIEGGAHEGDGPVDMDATLLSPPQRGGAAWLALLYRRALTDPQGNGKTPQVIRAYQLLRKRGLTDPMLIVCTGAAVFDWADSFTAWAPELEVRTITGTAAKRREAILGKPADVYIIAWPNLRMHTRLARYPGKEFVRCPACGGIDTKVTVGRCEVHEKELNQVKLGLVVADEAHRMKDANSKWTRAVWYLAHRAENFWPITGTWTVDNIGDGWPVLHGLDPKAFPAKSRFLDLFAMKVYNWGRGNEVLGLRPDNENAYHAIVQPMTRRIPKEVARPWMPPRLKPQFRYPEMSPEQAKAYKELSKHMLADLDSGLLVPANHGVRFGRLTYLASASIELVDGEDPDGFTLQQIQLMMPSSKVDDLVEFLEDNDGPLVVAANTPKLIALAERKLASLGISHCKIVGGMNEGEKHQSVRWFQDGQCQVIFLTPRAGGESITLTRSDTVFWMQPTPSWLEDDQLIGRVDRMGQANPVRVVYSMSQGTVDERMFQLSRDRQERAAQVDRDPDLLRWLISGEETRPAGQEAMF